MAIADQKFDWGTLFIRYLNGERLKDLCFEATGDRTLPRFGTLRNFASKNQWKAARAAHRRQQRSDAKLHFCAEKGTAGDSEGNTLPRPGSCHSPYTALNQTECLQFNDSKRYHESEQRRVNPDQADKKASEKFTVCSVQRSPLGFGR